MTRELIVNTYAEQTVFSVTIYGCRELATYKNCELLEVEQLWEGIRYNGSGK
jgi:hypothetical protein